MPAPSQSNKRRLIAMLAIVIVAFFLLAFRLVQVQIIDAPELQEMAVEQWTRDLPVPARRGKILDRNGQIVAQSGTAYQVYLRPGKIERPDDVANMMSEMLGLDRESVYTKAVDKKKDTVLLKRQISRQLAEEINALNNPGIVTTIDTKRYYPMRNLLSQLIGFTTVDGEGQAGLELQYDKYLKGLAGRTVAETDLRGRELPLGAQQYIPPRDGYNVILTIDAVVQTFLEKALDEALIVNNALSVQGIVMNPKTGEILALSTKPDFDLNAPPRDDMTLLQSLMKNKIFTDQYEPGSTFKIITTAAGLDSGTVTVHDTFNCGGAHIVDGQRIKCWKAGGHPGGQDLAEGVRNSCNPVFMQIALRMQKDTFYDYIYRFGFGSPTDAGFVGEGKGDVRHIKYVKNVDLARIGFGQAIAVTPIQLAAAVSATINGGVLMRPSLVKEISTNDGEIVEKFEPVPVRRVIKEETSAIMRDILESVVKDGSGRNAHIPGFRVGGKTGTAQKYDEVTNKPSSSKLIASFVGFAPADDPELLCLILVDEPQVSVVFGSTVAAPLVQSVLNDTLKYRKVTPQYAEGEAPRPDTEVPDVRHMQLAEAAALLQNSNLRSHEDGTGMVVSQMPMPGSKIPEGTSVLLYMSSQQPEADEIVPLSAVVPDVKGLSRLKAYDALEAAGLVLEAGGDEGAEAKAIDQLPKAGSMVEEGAAILVDFELENKPPEDEEPED